MPSFAGLGSATESPARPPSPEGRSQDAQSSSENPAQHTTTSGPAALAPSNSLLYAGPLVVFCKACSVPSEVLQLRPCHGCHCMYCIHCVLRHTPCHRQPQAAAASNPPLGAFPLVFSFFCCSCNAPQEAPQLSPCYSCHRMFCSECLHSHLPCHMPPQAEPEPEEEPTVTLFSPTHTGQ